MKEFPSFRFVCDDYIELANLIIFTKTQCLFIIKFTWGYLLTILHFEKTIPLLFLS